MPHRRREVSRVEGFSDAVFGFAITLLVVSLEVPRTFDELMAAMRGFPAFAVCFALIFQVWRRHYRFFRDYDLEDNTVITLTGILLFVVLFYVYPLKFLWAAVFSQFSDHPISEQMIRRDQFPVLFEIYGVGVAATFGVLAAMYAHAYRRRTALELTPLDIVDVRAYIWSNIGLAAIGLVSVAVAAIAGRFAPNLVGISGYVYFLIGLMEWWVGSYRGRLRAELGAR
jgi:uncharacterized membrane protein